MHPGEKPLSQGLLCAVSCVTTTATGRRGLLVVWYSASLSSCRRSSTKRRTQDLLSVRQIWTAHLEPQCDLEHGPSDPHPHLPLVHSFHRKMNVLMHETELSITTNSPQSQPYDMTRRDSLATTPINNSSRPQDPVLPPILTRFTDISLDGTLSSEFSISF